MTFWIVLSPLLLFACNQHAQTEPDKAPQVGRVEALQLAPDSAVPLVSTASETDTQLSLFKEDTPGNTPRSPTSAPVEAKPSELNLK